MMDHVVHHRSAKDDHARHAEDSLSTEKKRPGLLQVGVARPGDGGARRGNVLIEPLHKFLP